MNDYDYEATSLLAVLRDDARALRLHRQRFWPFVFPNFTAVAGYRVARALRDKGCGAGARAVSVVAQMVTGAELDPGAVIGPGFSLAHTDGIVVGEGVRAGRGLRLYSGVVLGSTSNARRGYGHPTLGDNVVVWSKATIAGPVYIADGAQIGAHALVMRDVTSSATIVGNHV